MDFELAGNYPIIIDGKETGTVDVSREGLFWTFEATSEMESGIIRLSVFGDRGEGYLGIMEPRENLLKLKKKLSRDAMLGFPRRITHAGRRGDFSDPPPPSETSEPQSVYYEEPPQTYTGAAENTAAPETQRAGDDNWASETPQGKDEYIVDAGSAGEGAGEEHQPTETPVVPMVVHRPNMLASKQPQGTGARQAAPRQERQSAVKQDKPAEAAPAEKPPGPFVWKYCGCPAAHLSTMIGKSIFGVLKNVMEAEDGEYIYLAVPESAEELTASQQRLFSADAIIMGERHLICKIKNGIIVP